MKKAVFVLAFIVVLTAVLLQLFQKPVLHEEETPTGTSYYQGVGLVSPKVSIFAENIGQVTQIEITPDGKYMLVGTLPGTVWIFHKVDGVFLRQIDPFFVVQTAHPGFPPREAGLTGIILGVDFATSGDVFLNYSFASGKKDFHNRITRVTFRKTGKKVVGKNPVLIFEANTKGSSAHQIQDGVGFLMLNKFHILFTIGEGFKPKDALNPRKEAGKVMLIQRDGSPPIGIRPFKDSPKVQALGIRNAPAIAYNVFANTIAIADTGPNHYDRFLYGGLVNVSGNNSKQTSFNWDGTEASLLKPVTDPDLGQDMVLHRWSPTETAVNIAFYENEKLPKLSEKQQYILVTLFGKTGYKSNKPGKKILLGTITHGMQNRIDFQTLVERTESGEGKLSHPLGLAVDPITKVIYFGDIMEGRIYQVEIE